MKLGNGTERLRHGMGKGCVLRRDCMAMSDTSRCKGHFNSYVKSHCWEESGKLPLTPIGKSQQQEAAIGLL